MDNTLHLVFWTVIFSLATWRGSSILAKENGPFWIFNYIRDWMGGLSRKPGVIGFAADSFQEGMSCMWCNSVWFGMFFALFLASNFGEWIGLALCMSFAAISIQLFLESKGVL